MQDGACSRVGIYVRESRDDYGENFDTIENQREMLLDFAAANRLGSVCAVYMDDNVSGSAFERRGLERLRGDVLGARLDLLLVKDLSRLGRNNAKTLLFLDFLEENGVRVVCSDGRYDSARDNDTVGIETWANERYIRDISRKIRSSLHFKIQRGEYLGHAPYGYKKPEPGKNVLCPDEAEAETVRLIYSLYRSGLGYTAIAAQLDERDIRSPENGGWNRITVRRILCSPVYTGVTVQGVSEKVSFKSKKTRRLPQDAWVVTEGTHEAIIPCDEFQEVQQIRQARDPGRGPHKSAVYALHSLVWCGGCGSMMYARKRKDGIAYICGNYSRRGRAACTSHFVYEGEIVRHICAELQWLLAFTEGKERDRLLNEIKTPGNRADREILTRQLNACQRQQEMLYTDRLEGRISEQLFSRMNEGIERRLRSLHTALEKLSGSGSAAVRGEISSCIEEAARRFEKGLLTNEFAKLIVRRITVYDAADNVPEHMERVTDQSQKEVGMIRIDFIMDNRYNGMSGTSFSLSDCDSGGAP